MDRASTSKYTGGNLGDGTSAPVYYEFNDQHFIIYWFFYPYNAGGAALSGDESSPPAFDNHHGDWENVSVRLNCKDEPIGAAYYAHGAPALLDWPGQEATPDEPSRSADAVQLVAGTHLPAFSALGTHATYATPGEHDLKYSVTILGHTFGAIDRTGGGAPWNAETRSRTVGSTVVWVRRLVGPTDGEQ